MATIQQAATIFGQVLGYKNQYQQALAQNPNLRETGMGMQGNILDQTHYQAQQGEQWLGNHGFSDAANVLANSDVSAAQQWIVAHPTLGASLPAGSPGDGSPSGSPSGAPSGNPGTSSGGGLGQWWQNFTGNGGVLGAVGDATGITQVWQAVGNTWNGILGGIGNLEGQTLGFLQGGTGVLGSVINVLFWPVVIWGGINVFGKVFRISRKEFVTKGRAA